MLIARRHAERCVEDLRQQDGRVGQRNPLVGADGALEWIHTEGARLQQVQHVRAGVSAQDTVLAVRSQTAGVGITERLLKR